MDQDQLPDITKYMTRTEAACLFGVSSDELLTREEAASLLRVTPRTLLNWQEEGRGPRAAKVGGRTVLYSKRELLAYVESCKQPSPIARHEPQRINPIVAAERTRAMAIIAQTPKGLEAFAIRAINEGMTPEAFAAELPAQMVLFAGAMARGEK